MRKSIFFILSLFFITLSAQSPGGVSGVDLWIKADSDNTSQPYYQDFGYGHHQVQASDVQSRPGYGLLNYNDSFLFNGQKSSLMLKYLMETHNRISIYSVFQNKELSKETALFTTDNSGEKVLYYGTANIFRYGGDSLVYANPAQLDSTVSFSMYAKFDVPSKKIGFASGNTGKSSLYIGKDIRSNDGWQNFKGNLPELFIYNKILTLNERNRVNSYLAIKYGISLPYTEYLSSHSKKLWKQEDYNDYPFHTTGIGRDDFSALYQKQSTNSAESKRLIIAAETLAQDNRKNTASFSDRSFLIWADDGKPLNPAKEEFGMQPLERKWKARLTSEQNQNIKSQVVFNAKGVFDSIPADKKLWLLIDRSGNGHFNTDSEALPADVMNDKGEVTFSNVYFDNDFSGTDVFTFALAAPMFALYDLEQATCKTQEGRLTLNIKGGKAPYHLNLTADNGFSGNNTVQGNDMSYNQLKSGHYTLNIKDALSYEQSYEFDITSFEGLNLNLGGEIRIGSEGYAEVDASQNITIPDAAYQWTSDNGFSSTQPKVKLYETGNYSVTVTTKDGCSKTENLRVSSSNQNEIVIFPNPTHAGDDFTIRIRLSQPEDVEINIYDMSGKLISSKKLNGKSSYDIKDKLLVQDAYVVTVVTTSQKKVFKLIIN